MHQGKNEKFFVCQQGPTGAEIGTLGPMGRIMVKMKKSLVCQQGPIGDEIGTLGVRAWVRVLIFD